MQEPIIYNCKENDSRLKVVIEDGKIGEIWIEDPTHKEQWFVVGFQDLKNAIKEAEATMGKKNYVVRRKNFNYILKTKSEESIVDQITEECKEEIKGPVLWLLIQSGTEMYASMNAYSIIKQKGLLSKYFVPIEEEPPFQIHNPEPKFIPMQICPVCVGEGRITSQSTSAAFQQCPKCYGERTIPMAKA